MLRDKESRKHFVLSLNSNEFHSDIHKMIFAGLETLVETKLDYTTPTLLTLLPDDTDWGGKEYLEELGYTVTSTVSGKTDYLVCEDGSNSSKTKKAESLEIPIVTIDNLR